MLSEPVNVDAADPTATGARAVPVGQPVPGGQTERDTADPDGPDPDSADLGCADLGGADPGCADPGSAGPGCADPHGAHSDGAGPGGVDRAVDDQSGQVGSGTASPFTADPGEAAPDASAGSGASVPAATAGGPALGVADVEVAEVGAAEVRAAEARVTEIGVAEVRVAEVGVTEVKAAEARVTEVGAAAGRWRAPLLWRVMVRVVARVLAGAVCRLRVTGDLPAAMRDGPVIVAVNHVGPFDPLAVCAAFGSRRLAPRLMATGGLFRAPLVGGFMRACGHIRVNRRQADVAGAVDDVMAALAQGSIVVGYPEGRITLDPGMWPERGRTGLARVALRMGVPVVPVAQWGAHEVVTWGGFWPSLARIGRSLVRRPVVRVRFGPPVDLSGLVDGAPGAAQKATDRIMDAIVAELAVLRVDEPRLPRYIDPVRPLSTARSHRRADPGVPPRPASGVRTGDQTR